MSCGFDLAHYGEILAAAKAGGYRFTHFEGAPAEGTVILRHDVDLSLDAAVRMAELEHGADHQGWVDILGVVPEARRGGLGRALLADGLRWIESKGASEAVLGVDAQNEKALTLYQSLGFEPLTETHVYNKRL